MRRRLFKNKWVELAAMGAVLALDFVLLFYLMHLLKRMGMEVYIL